MPTKISELEKEGEIYEVEGTVIKVLDVKEVMSKKNGKLKVQNIDIKDDLDSEDAVSLRITLWQEDTNKFEVGDRVAVKGIFEKYNQYYQMKIPRDGYIKKLIQ